jgi:calreticulin
MRFALLFTIALFAAACSAEIYFSEEFGDGWENRWVISTNKGESAGNFVHSAGKFFGDAETDRGLKTGKDARFYQISAEMKEFSNKGKDLVIQYSAKHEQHIDCGGAYIKILPAGIDQTNFNGDSPYNVMFGPDICGNTKRIHAILNHKEKNHLIKGADIKAPHDEWTHLYTFIIHPDKTFEVLVDDKEVKTGTLQDNWDLLAPKEILDPNQSKPADWVDERQIADPEAKKPEGWDDIPKQIADKTAEKPADWDAELDGEWEAPLIDNPDYKGEWSAPMIDNPAYKGEWVHPKIANPDYVDDPSIGVYESNKYVGIEIWQVKSGTIFDNFLVTDSVATAKLWAKKTLTTQEAEKEAFEKDKEEKAKEAAENAKSGTGSEEHDGEDDDAEFDPSMLEGLSGEFDDDEGHDEL